MAAWLLSACRPEPYRAAYAPVPGTHQLRIQADLAGSGALGARDYLASTEAWFTFRSGSDSATGQLELSFSVDSLRYRSSERDSVEGKYMAGKLLRYRVRLVLSPTGQLLSLEEEPSLPPVEFSTLNFGRMLAYAFPVFPSGEIRVQQTWQAEQPLLDKFHPKSRAVKKYRAGSLKETPQGRLLTCRLELEAHLEEDLGQAETGPALQGGGEVVFNLDRGLPVAADLELEGRFLTQIGAATGDSAAPAGAPVKLTERFRLRFE